MNFAQTFPARFQILKVPFLVMLRMPMKHLTYKLLIVTLPLALALFFRSSL